MDRIRHKALQILAAATATATMLAAGAAGAAVNPTDDRFREQWALRADGPLNGPAAWAIATGARQVVAVLDTGIEASHPDLRGALWSNAGEVAGNGLDDDGNGHVDDVHGVDLVDKDGDPDDANGHGTTVAGVIGAQLDGAGVVGLAPDAQIMSVKVVAGDGHGTAAVLARGIRYAIAEGATIVNTSLIAERRDKALAAALGAAEDAGVLVVASAGNASRDLDLLPAWPAAEPSVVATAASDRGSLLADFSNFGARTVDVAAPGTKILTTARGASYDWRKGTSMAAPQIAATLALIRSAAPALTPAQARELVLSTAARPKGLLGRLSAGEVDPVAALRTVATERPLLLSARVRRRNSRRALVTWTPQGDAAAVASFRVSSGGRTLTVRPPGARGAWVLRRHSRVQVTARDAAGEPLTAVTVTLRRARPGAR